ncbi:MAG: hypothetical protein ACRDFX_06605 [Chloroflexota bacterium]
MSWDIKVWHDDLGERVRLTIEAGPQVPDEVISSIAGSYWVDEVQFFESEWSDPMMEAGPEESGPKIHG